MRQGKNGKQIEMDKQRRIEWIMESKNENKNKQNITINSVISGDGDAIDGKTSTERLKNRQEWDFALL